MVSVIRRMAGLLAVSVVLSAIGTGSAFAEFKSGPWTGGAYAGKDNKFERCVITSEQPNGVTLGFGKFIDGAFEIWLTNKSWNLTPNTPQHVSLWVDSLDKRDGNFQVVAKNTMAGQFSVKDTKLADELKRGSVLHMTTPGGAFDFKLTGTSKAIGDLEQCWAENSRAGGAAQNQAGQNQAGQKQAGQKPVGRVKGMDLLALTPRDFAAQVVTSGKAGYFTIPDKMPDAMKQWNAALVWNADGDKAIGLVSGVGSNPDVQVLRDDLVRQKKPRCKGDMASSSDVQTLPGTAIQVKRVEIRCSDIGNGTGVTELFSFYPHLSGQLLVISHISRDRAMAVQADGEFAKRVIAILTAK